MINVDEIAKECEQMISGGLDFIAPKSCCNAKQVAELVVMLRDAQRDAERYLWLRNSAHTVTGLTPCAFVMKDGDLMEDWNGQYGLLCLGALDAAVDEAIKCER